MPSSSTLGSVFKVVTGIEIHGSNFFPTNPAAPGVIVPSSAVGIEGVSHVHAIEKDHSNRLDRWNSGRSFDTVRDTWSTGCREVAVPSEWPSVVDQLL